MDSRLRHLRQSDPLNKIPAKSDQNVRFLTFNVNGCKTLFKYHPWNNLLNSYDDMLGGLDADIVSLQELKVQLDALNPLGLVKNYRAFISIPKSKKGYSGVALYVRKPQPHEHALVQKFLTVVKAEEGITGRLPGGDPAKTPYFLLPSDESIGGYLDYSDVEDLNIDEEQMEKLDSEGRCVVVELACNLVVFSLYCPANSIGTESGELFRLQFLDVLLRRCQKLKKMGKDVVIMGDINVSMDLIDNAEAINTRIKQKKVVNNLSDGPSAFEKANSDECLAFRTSAPQRSLLNLYTHPTIDAAPRLPTQFLFDTTRLVQKRRMAMYSVWNTLTNARQSNYGSRIDLILVSCPVIAQNLDKADILPYLNGSDHCPVFTDVQTSYQTLLDIPELPKLHLEAKSFYKLVKHRDISSMFGSMRSKRTPDSQELTSSDRTPPAEKKQKVEYTSRKKVDSQQLIKNFFFQDKIRPKQERPEEDSASKSGTEVSNSTTIKLNSIAGFASLVYNDPPNCKHGEPCCLKTSLTKESKGRKFWCCARNSKGNSGTLGEHRCEFFEWARVNKAK